MIDETPSVAPVCPEWGEAPLRILILNWRDIRHPAAGGAERVTYEMARRWVAWGHAVTWFAASFPGATAREMVDGIDVWRAGSQATVHWQAFRHYRRHFRGRFDVVVDEVNTIPFLAPLYARTPVVLFLHQLAREVWFYEAPRSLAALGYMVEPVYFQPYRGVPLLTVSQSSQRDAARLGLRSPTTILPLGSDLPPVPRLPDLGDKESRWTLICVGRVVPSKRVDHAIEALRWLREKHGQRVQLWIVGAVSDTYRETLGQLVAREGLTEDVVFWGHVPVTTKRDLLQRAHILVMTSIREGWGLAVTEAARVGTPSTVYDVPGLRDSTAHDETGLVAPQNSPEGLADSVAQLLRDADLYARLRETAWERTATMSWDRTAEAGLGALNSAIARWTGSRVARRVRGAVALARRVDWTYAAAIAAGTIVLLLSLNYPLAVAAGLLVACVLGRISPAVLMVTGLMFVAVAGGLAVLDQLGWINQSPQLTVMAGSLGLADLRNAENGAGLNAFELFAAATAGFLVRTVRVQRKEDQ